MLIVHVLLGVPDPDTLGGVNRVADRLARELVPLADVRVAAFVDDLHSADALRPPYGLVLLKRSRERFRLSPRARAFVDGLPRDAWVQFHSVFIPDFAAMARALRRRGIRYGVTPHGALQAAVMQRGHLKKSLYLALIERRMLRGAALVQALTTGERGEIERLLPGLDLCVIPNGQDVAADPSLVRTPAWCAARYPRSVIELVFCGRIEPYQKGLDLLIDALAAFNLGAPRATLSLLGGGDALEPMRARARQAGCGGEVSFLGPRFGVDRDRRVVDADFAVLVSRFEGLPLSVLEASALGVPSLLTPQTNLVTEVRAHGAGVVCEQPTVPAIVRALEAAWSAAQDADRMARYSAGAMDMVHSGFSWRHVARRLLAEVSRRTGAPSAPSLSMDRLVS